MTIDEAMEAAARALCDLAEDDWTPGANGAYEDQARAALVAAAPYMFAGVVALANVWEALGERDIADSKTFEDEDIAMAFLTEGANKVEAARHLRNALITNPYRRQA